MNPEQTQILLNSLKADLILSKEIIRETAMEMVQEEYSNFPIFVAHQISGGIPLGENIIDHEELGLSWSIHVSTLQEFLDKGIIKKDREMFFRETYKDPKEYACFFMITPTDGQFAFIPYESREKPENSHL